MLDCRSVLGHVIEIAQPGGENDIMWTIVIFTIFAAASTPATPVVTTLQFSGDAKACDTVAGKIGFTGAIGSGVGANGYTVRAICVPYQQ